MVTIRNPLAGVAVFFLIHTIHGQALPDLVPVDLQIPPTITAAPNSPAQVVWGIANQGNGEASGYWNDVLYISTKPYFDATATFLTYQSTPGPIEPGETYWNTNAVTLPVVESGPYYLLLKANAYGYLQESDTSNNLMATPFTFESTPADLAALSLVVPSSVTGPPNPYVTVAYAVTNQGPGTASGGWSDALFISTQPSLDPSATQVAYQYEVSSVPVGGRYWRTNRLRLPVIDSGTFYMIFQADRDNSLYETATNNNLLVAEMAFVVQPPDLAPLPLQVPNAITTAPNATLTLVWGVTNQGAGAAIGNYSWRDELYLSADPVLDASDRYLAALYETGPVAPGGTYWRTNVVRIPTIDTGTYYLIFKTDVDNSLHDANPGDNTIAVPVAFTILRPDLVPVARVPAVIEGPPYPPVSLAFGATNQGAGAAIGGWMDYVYLSMDATIDGSDAAFGFNQGATVPSGGSYWQTNTFRLPVTADGTYYFIFEANKYGDPPESDPLNNVLAVPVRFHILPPDLAPIALQVPTLVTSPPNAEITFIWGVTNQGSGSAIGNWSWMDQVYLSTNALWDSTAIALNSGYETGPFAPGESYWRTNALRVPVVRSGTYYFIFKTDTQNSLIESDEDNNTLVVPVVFTVQPPDLAPLVSEIATAFTGPPNPSLTLIWGVTNQGTGLARGYWAGWYDGVLLSTDPVLDGQDALLAGWLDGGPLVAGGSYWRTNSVIVPITQSGTYYLIFKADRFDYLYEEDKNNNVAVVPVAFTVLPPDLAPLALDVPAVITGPPNPTTTVVCGVTNQGIGPAVVGNWSWSDGAYLSRNATLDASDIPLLSLSEFGPVAAGASYWRTNSFRVPVTRSTNCYLIFKTDTGDSVFESNEGNNTLAVPVRFEIQPPDLAPVVLLVTNAFIGPPNPTLTLVWGVTNRGPGIAETEYYWSWSDRVYLSTNSVLDNTATYLGDTSEPGPLPAGSSYWRTNQLRLPVVQSGTYYVFFTTDADRRLYESDFANNTVSAPVTLTILPPDLAVLGLQVQGTFSGPPRPRLTIAWGVTNQGVGPTGDAWRDLLYLSSTPIPDETASVLGEFYEYGPVAAGGNYWRTNIVTMPVVESRTYYLIFKTDYANWLAESDLGNNSISVPVSFTILPPDLSPVALRVTNLVIGPPNPSLTVVWGVTNQGLGAAIGDWGWSDTLSLSSGPTPDTGYVEVGSFPESGPIAPGESYWRTNTFRLPIVESGVHYLMFNTDAYGSLFESCWTNNQIAFPVTFQILPPDLAPIAFQAPGQVTGSANPAVRVMWGVTNQGPGTALGNATWWDRVYLSTDRVLDPGDQMVIESPEQGPVAPGSGYWRSRTVHMPVTQSGSYNLIFSIDADRLMHESDYSNNTVVLPISFNISPADLAPFAFQAPPTVTGAGFPSVTFVWGVTNQGPGAAGTQFVWNWCDAVYLSTDPVLDSSDPNIFSSCDTAPVAAGGSYWRTNTARVPVTQSGAYYFIFKTDANDVVAESDKANNLMILPVTIHVAPVDLAPIALQFPSVVTGSPDPTVTVVYEVANVGTVPTSPDTYWYDQVCLSATNVPDGTEIPVLWSSEIGPIAPGDSYWRTNSAHMPVAQNGSYYLLFKTDVGNYQNELNLSNNFVARPITFELQPSDVAPIDLRAPAQVTGPPYPMVTLSWGITNQGQSAAVGGWGWWHGIYVSTRPALDESATLVSPLYETNTLAPGGFLRFTNTVQLPINTSGQYYLLLQANMENQLHEANVTNDVKVVPIGYTMAPPDLAPVFFQAPPIVSGPPPLTLTLAWGITNQGQGTAQGSWPWSSIRPDGLWLSRTPERGDDALFLGSWEETNSVAPGESYWRTNTVRVPGYESGSYYLILIANYPDSGIELVRSNNVAILPITLNLTPPDLVPLGLQVPSVVTGQPHPEITVVWGVTNQGSGPAVAANPPFGQYPPPLIDGLYLSRSPSLDWGSWPFAGWIRTSVAVGEGYWQTNRIRVPVSDSGTYYLILKADAYGAVFESDEANNFVAVPVTFNLSPPGDLAVLSLVAPRSVTGPGNPSVTLSWQVGNEGFGPLSGTWSDTLSLSLPFGPETPVGTFPETNSLPVGAAYSRTKNLILPVTQSGDYQLTLRTSLGSSVFDLDDANSELTVPVTFNITGSASIRIGDMQLLSWGVFMLSVYGTVGDRYQLEASTNLANWVRVVDFVCTSDPTWIYDREAGRYGHRFYRIAPLTGSPALRLDFVSPSWTADGPLLKLDGPVGMTYRIEASPDLVDWQPITSVSAVILPTYVRDPSAVNQHRRFYRAVQE
jgi:subtilase family serine protease